MAKAKDYTGAKYGKLTVVERYGKDNKTNLTLWHLRCECGKDVYWSTHRFANGKVKSCGCGDKGKPAEDLKGKEFQHLVVQNRDLAPSHNTKWFCKCKICGKIKSYYAFELKRGTVDCQCVKFKRPLCVKKDSKQTEAQKKAARAFSLENDAKILVDNQERMENATRSREFFKKNEEIIRNYFRRYGSERTKREWNVI